MKPIYRPLTLCARSVKSYLLAILALTSAAFAQTPVARPSTPTSSDQNKVPQLAAWYRYAVYLEAVVAQRNTELAAAKIDSTKISAILTGIVALDAKISAQVTQPPPAQLPPDATAPIFTLGPSSQEIPSGTSATFTVAASGNPAPEFQWYVNGALIPGATKASLTRGPYVFPDGSNSQYIVVARNGAGSAVAGPAALWVAQSTPPTPPVITPTNPDDAYVGSPVTFLASADGVPSPTFTWKKNGVPIAGATTGTLMFAAVALTDSGTYAAVASNASGSSEATVKLNVIPKP